MNGGDKLYIWKDGFIDVYNATPAEEEEWKQELIDGALIKIATENNKSSLEIAISNLAYHHYEGLDELLLQSIEGASPARQIIFAVALWKRKNYTRSFEIIFDILLQHRAECLNEVFTGLNDFKNHIAARHFMINCLEGEDADLFNKAQRTLFIWAWSGMPALREDKLLETFQFENKNLPAFHSALERIKEILDIQK